MVLPDSIDVYAAKLSGLAGALFSLGFINGTWPERIWMAAGGSVISFYASPFAAEKTSLPEGLCGFMLGLFGMAICAKVWEGIQAMPIAEFWNAAIERFKRLIG